MTETRAQLTADLAWLAVQSARLGEYDVDPVTLEPVYPELVDRTTADLDYYDASALSRWRLACVAAGQRFQYPSELDGSAVHLGMDVDLRHELMLSNIALWDACERRNIKDDSRPYLSAHLARCPLEPCRESARVGALTPENTPSPWLDPRENVLTPWDAAGWDDPLEVRVTDDMPLEALAQMRNRALAQLVQQGVGTCKDRSPGAMAVRLDNSIVQRAHLEMIDASTAKMLKPTRAEAVAEVLYPYSPVHA